MAKPKETIIVELIEALEEEEKVYYLTRRWKKIIIQALEKELKEKRNE